MSPFTRLDIIGGAIPLVRVCDLRNQRIIRIRIREQRQDAQKNFGNRKRRTPLLFQNIKADSTSCVDIRMIDLRLESDDRRLERIVTGKSDTQTKGASVKGRIRRSED